MLSADAAQASVSTQAAPSARALIAVAQLLQINAIDRKYLQPDDAKILCQCEKRNKGGRRGANELRAAGNKATAKPNRAGTKRKTRAARVTVKRDHSRLSSDQGTKR